MLVTEKDPNASVLRSNTVPIQTGDEAVALIIALEREAERIGGCVGLAAPQIGLSKSLAIIRHAGISINLINPSVVAVSEQFTHRGEGCKSLPGRRFDVPRHKKVTIKNHILWPSMTGAIPLFDDPNKKPLDRVNPPKGLFLVPVTSTYVLDNDERDSGGLVCIGVQHEIEHLMGVTVDKKPGSVEVVSNEPGSKWDVGRNDPCPCGKKDENGKPFKFKKCCLSRVGQAALATGSTA
jgi:peptide deformylase